jgi:hypothetical protein
MGIGFMNWPVYSLRHHFTAVLLVLPLLAFSIHAERPVSELYKLFGLAALLVISLYYLFLYKFHFMLGVSLVFTGVYLALYFGFLGMGVVIGCPFLNNCGPVDYVVYAFASIGRLGALSVCAFLGLSLIWAYVRAGKRLGLRDK